MWKTRPSEIGQMISYQYSTGGGAKYQHNCFPRAVAIATNRSYRTVLAEINKISRKFWINTYAEDNEIPVTAATELIDAAYEHSTYIRKTIQCQHGTANPVLEELSLIHI